MYHSTFKAHFIFENIQRKKTFMYKCEYVALVPLFTLSFHFLWQKAVLAFLKMSFFSFSMKGPNFPFTVATYAVILTVHLICTLKLGEMKSHPDRF